jgi:hypothetical protein
VLINVAWIGTYLPYTWWKGGAALSANVADLAEWVSLVPGVRYGAQPMLIPGLLRAVPALFAVGISLEGGGAVAITTRRLTLLLAILICVGALPPFDFFRGGWGDINYQNQLAIALLGAFGVIGVRVLARRERRFGGIGPFVALLGISAALTGYFGSRAEFARFQTALLPGPGLVLSVAAALLYFGFWLRVRFRS